MRLAIAVDPSDPSLWAERLNFAAAGFEPIFLRLGDGGSASVSSARVRWLRGSSRVGGVLPDFGELVEVIGETGVEGCMVVGRGPLALLCRAAAEVTGRPVVELVDTLGRLPGPGPRCGSRPDLFLLTASELPEQALDDPRYGSTLLALGDPARDTELEGGEPAPSGGAVMDRGSGARLLAFLDRWRRDDLEPPDPELSVSSRRRPC